MRRERALTILRDHEVALRSLGLQSVSLFGSTARDEASSSSDIDLAVRLDQSAGIDLFRYAAITDQLRNLLGRPVDLVTEPSRSRRMQAMIERDRVCAF